MNWLELIAAPGFVAILTWILARKKYLAEVSKSELDNVEQSIAIYRKMVDDLGARIDLLSGTLNLLRKENEALTAENRGLKKRQAAMDKEIQRLKTRQDEDISST